MNVFHWRPDAWVGVNQGTRVDGRTSQEQGTASAKVLWLDGGWSVGGNEARTIYPEQAEGQGE